MPDTLASGQSLPVNGTLNSADGRFVLVMQGDANLVMYRQGGAARWATGTDGKAFGRLDMQTDGNLVMYDPAGKALWASGTSGHPGARLVLQTDGNLVIYSPTGTPLWASGTNLQSRRVPGFTPSRNGLHFINAFPNAPDYQIHVGTQTISIGNAANGLCGGMSYAVRDIFQAGQLPPSTTTAPTSGPLFDFIARRLLDSFELPVGPLKYLALMSTLLPDHETSMSQAGLAPHGRSWVMVHDEWPKIRAELDAGRLVNLALIQIKSLNPGDMGQNHQVLAWGYDVDGNDVDLRIYDPNCLDMDNVCLSFNSGDPQHTTPVRYDVSTHPVFCFYRTGYNFVAPPSFVPLPPKESFVTVVNQTPNDQAIRIFAPNDTVMLVALTAGEFTLRPGESGRWKFQPGLNQVKLTANGRLLGLASPGQTLSIVKDDRVVIANRTDRQLVARFYRSNDGLMWATLPDGDRRVSPHMDMAFTVPAGMANVKVVIDGRATTASLGQTIVINV
jgi:hypothetical protein